MSDFNYYLECGCKVMDNSLGIQKMPLGYHLLLDADGMYFFWMEPATGREGAVHWDKWAVYRAAKADSEGHQHRFKEVAEEIERLRDALWEVKKWADAYPETVFLNPDFDRMREVLAAAGMPTALDAAHGTWGRHICEGIGKIANDAIKDTSHE